MARPAGLEPATHGLEIRCSIQLSYDPVCVSLGFYKGFTLLSVLQLLAKIAATPKPTLKAGLRSGF